MTALLQALFGILSLNILFKDKAPQSFILLAFLKKLIKILTANKISILFKKSLSITLFSGVLRFRFDRFSDDE